MTLSLVGYVSANNPVNTVINVNLPGGAAAGDLCVGCEVTSIDGCVLPSGFTELDAAISNDENTILSFYRILTSGDIANGYVTMPGDPGWNGARFCLWVWHSSGGTPTVDGHLTRATSDITEFTTVVNSGSIVTTKAGDGICVCLASRDSGTVWSSVPGGVTVDQNTPTGYEAIYAYHYTQAGAGTTAAQSATIDVSYAREQTFLVGVADVGAATLGRPFGRAFRRH